MPTKGDEPDLLVDTSAALALVLEDHEGHDVTFETLGDRRLGLAGHAAFETYSVLTRLPPPARRTPSAAARLIASNFPASRFLAPDACRELLDNLPTHAIAGGSVYDALVAATANAWSLPLATRDRRARSTYYAMGVDIELIASS